MLQISPRRVAHVIVRARELETKVASLGLTAGGHDADSILESRRGDATASELSAFIARLNDEDYLEEGLDKLGISSTEAEEDFL